MLKYGTFKDFNFLLSHILTQTCCDFNLPEIKDSLIFMAGKAQKTVHTFIFNRF